MAGLLWRCSSLLRAWPPFWCILEEFDGADGFGLEAFAAERLGCDRPFHVCDANAVAYNFVQSLDLCFRHHAGSIGTVLLRLAGDVEGFGVFYDDSSAPEDLCLPKQARRFDMWLGIRVGEASYPGPAGKAAKLRKQLGLQKPASRDDIKKVCQEVLRGFLQELGGTLQLAPVEPVAC